jgi:hypothetical protein
MDQPIEVDWIADRLAHQNPARVLRALGAHFGYPSTE